MNPYEGPVVKILLDLDKDKREEAIKFLALVVPPRHITRLRILIALEVAQRN